VAMVQEANTEVERFMTGLVRRNPAEPEFQQAVREFVDTVMPFVMEHSRYRDAYILERMTEPDRVIIFRVCWQDDENNIRTNRAYRVQFNNAIGPYKGGLRFHPSVTLSILKFLGFEQTFKNSLTGLPMGGAKGGSDFNPKGKSDSEVMRFCQSMMIELARHIGEDVDVPAGDIGVGSREVSYLFGQYKRINNRFTGTITGKDISFGGSWIRLEATGYGLAFFVQNMLEAKSDGFEGKTCAVSGAGNVALYAAEKASQLGGKVITLSDSEGTVVDFDGIDEEKLAWIKQLKQVRRGRISEFAEHFDGVEFLAGSRPWAVPCDIALPCATQNELDGDDARELVRNGVIAVGEGANMPSTLEATHVFHDAKVAFAPGKAANAGGVAVSGLEQSQNSLRMSWTRDEVYDRLTAIMKSIHDQCAQYGDDGDGYIDYVKGANIAGFVKVANAMVAQGAV
jgi:glutamate dehydrogenase (NADP+)